MMRQGKIQFIDGLVGYVDVATQTEQERITGEATTGSGIILYIPFSGLTQRDIDATVEATRDVLEERKDANK